MQRCSRPAAPSGQAGAATPHIPWSCAHLLQLLHEAAHNHQTCFTTSRPWAIHARGNRGGQEKISEMRTVALHLLHHVQALHHAAKHHVLAVQPAAGGWRQADRGEILRRSSCCECAGQREQDAACLTPSPRKYGCRVRQAGAAGEEHCCRLTRGWTRCLQLCGTEGQGKAGEAIISQQARQK